MDAIQPLLGIDTTVATAMNGVPWWYFYKLVGPYENTRVKSVDPEGKQWDGIGPKRAIGCITYVAAEVVAPGVVKSGGSGRYFLGEPGGNESERCLRLAEVIAKTGIVVRVRPDLRADLWVKIMGNAAFNPTSALTLGTVGEMVSDLEMEALLRRMMDEVTTVGRALGSVPSASVDYRIENARENAMPHKSSMLQDLERGRMMEINPIIGAVQEMGALAGVPTPTIDTVLALVKLRARLGGMLPE
jgi:2-dehydropantoate 2-reductase